MDVLFFSKIEVNVCIGPFQLSRRMLCQQNSLGFFNDHRSIKTSFESSKVQYCVQGCIEYAVCTIFPESSVQKKAFFHHLQSQNNLKPCWIISLYAGLAGIRNPGVCGRRHSERYDNTSLFTVTYQLIYRHCTCTVQSCRSTSDQSDRRLGM